MFTWRFWAGVAVVFAMLQVTNWTAAAYGGITSEDRYGVMRTNDVGFLYIASSTICAVIYAMCCNVAVDWATDRDRKRAACWGVILFLLWVTVLTYNVFFDVYRAALSLPYGTMHVLVGLTAFALWQKYRQE